MEEKKKYRNIIAGGRHFRDYETLREQVESVFEKYGIVMGDAEIINDHAAGVDQLGKGFAKENGIRCTVFSANWSEYGRSAGFRRNAAMVGYAAEAEKPLVIAFWNGESHGTGFTIQKAREKGIPVEIFYYMSGKDAEPITALNEKPNENPANQESVID